MVLYKAETIYVCPDNLDDMLEDAGGSEKQKEEFKRIIVEQQSFEEGNEPTTLDEANTFFGYFCNGWTTCEKVNGLR